MDRAAVDLRENINDILVKKTFMKRLILVTLYIYNKCRNCTTVISYCPRSCTVSSLRNTDSHGYTNNDNIHANAATFNRIYRISVCNIHSKTTSVSDKQGAYAVRFSQFLKVSRSPSFCRVSSQIIYVSGIISVPIHCINATARPWWSG